MPRAIKLFLVLCLVYATCLIWANIAFIVVPPPHRLQTLAQLPVDIRATVNRAEWFAAAFRIILPLVFLLSFALIAVVGRRGWARWALTAFLTATVFWVFGFTGLMRAGAPDTFVLQFHDWSGVWRSWLGQWAAWQPWAWLMLKLAMIATIFGAGSEAWFRRTSDHPAVTRP